MHALICVTFYLPPGVGGWLWLLLVALPGLFCLHFFIYRDLVLPFYFKQNEVRIRSVLLDLEDHIDDTLLSINLY